MGRGTLRTNKVLAVTLAAILILSAVLVVADINFVRAIQGLVRSTTAASVAELSDTRARLLDALMESEQQNIIMFADDLGHMDNDPIIVRNHAFDFLEAYGASNVWIKSASGETWCTSDTADAYLESQQEELFKPALRGETGSSEMYVGYPGKKRILFYAPVIRDGAVSGAVYASFSLDRFQSAYSGSAYDNQGFSYVVDGDGAIVLSANHYVLLQSYDNFAELLEDTGNTGQEVDAFLKAMESGESGSIVLSIEGEGQYLCYTPLTAKEGWYFITMLPLSMVEANGESIVSLANSMVVALVGAVVVAAIAVVAAILYRSGRERESERHIQSLYQAIAANIDTSIFIVDPFGRRVEAVFENTQDVLGIPSEHFYRNDEADTNEAYRKIMQILTEANPRERGDWLFECRNDAMGRNMWFHVTSCPVRLAGADKLIFSLTDDTVEHETREHLMEAVAIAEEANRSKSNFLSNMSHDIRTPMNAIMGFTSLLEYEADDPRAVREYTQKIAASSRHLLGLINDVLDMSKIEAGKTTLSLGEFSMMDIVDSVEAMMRPQTDDRNQTFTVNTDGIDDRILVGDEGRLRQIIVNLLSNAVKYTPRGGHILFHAVGSVRPSGHTQHVRLMVKDDGIGMTEEYMATIFDPFSREESSLTNKVQGTGLGMTITKSLVELMGGRIKVESALGEGTEFTVDLELRIAENQKTQPSAKDEPKDYGDVLRGKHLLIAEDNDLNAEIIEALLENKGATCVIAMDGQEAYDRFLQSKPGEFDMILMDVQMPVMNGHEAARAIRRIAREDARTIPIVAMTANAFAEDVREALEAGMNAHVAKPIVMANLEKTAARLL